MSKSVFSISSVLFMFFVLSLSVNGVKGQDNASKNQSTTTKETASRKERFDISLHILITTDKQQSDNEKLPSALEAVAKQLRSSLNLKNINVIESFMYSAEEKSSVAANGLTAIRVSSSSNNQRANSAFYEVSFLVSELIKDNVGRGQIKLEKLRFGMRYPFVFDSALKDGLPTSVIDHEPVGLTLSSLSLTENEPTLLGTLGVGRNDGTLAIVLTVNRVISR